MTEQVNNTVDNSKPEVAAQVQQTQTAPTPAPEADKKALQEPQSVQEVNWKLFRETREKERKQREEAEKRAQEKEREAAAFKAALDAALNKPAPKDANYEDTEEDRIRIHVQKYIQEKEIEDEKRRVERDRQEMPQKLASVYSDFNRVCTTDNLDYLEFHYPEVAEAYKHMPDSFDKWSNIYKAIKRFIPNSDSKKDQAKAEKNFNTPQSMSKPGATPTGDTAPVYLDDKKKDDNWKRMQRVMKGV